MSANGVRWFVAAHLLAVLAIYLISVWIGTQHVAEPMPPLTGQASDKPARHTAIQASLPPPIAQKDQLPQETTGIQASADIPPPWAVR